MKAKFLNTLTENQICHHKCNMNCTGFELRPQMLEANVYLPIYGTVLSKCKLKYKLRECKHTASRHHQEVINVISFMVSKKAI